MKLGISHIAFKEIPLKDALCTLQNSSIVGIEIASSLLWSEPLRSSKEQRQEIKNLVTDHGIEVIGLQSLLYGQPNLRIFDTAKSRQSCLDYLKHMIELCHDLSGHLISFGSPQNRRRENLGNDKAFEIASEFFRDLAVTAANFGVVICFEPIASGFNCDFVNTSEEGYKLVERVNHPAFRLLLDTGNMTMMGESFDDIFKRYASLLYHVQVNDPQLTPPGHHHIDHSAVLGILNSISYDRWVSIECFLNDPFSLNELAYAFHCYGRQQYC